MEKIILLIALFVTSLSAAYNVGDVVEDLTWEDSNLDADGNIVVTQRSLHEIIDSGKVVLIDFGFTG
ncbi:MAG: hypothetical protein CR982_04745 [Candidatus Cloacimonadota bacterium]|nr:MAG: hypothetical protein CR982_04745 [Candidatus Cloacimonadota bacterium]PIE81756.1 MAG: hypothetical protein CSA15_00370 [Candidatus Delongbacteria bacterium]